MPDFSSLIDLNYFWWTFGNVLKPAMPFLVIFVAITAAGWLLFTIISAIRAMRN
jgi:hypothetical protein